jgi:hypothetical protein
MPFELGLAVEHARRTAHQWFVLEERRYRLQRTLSDLNGTDPYVHDAEPDTLLIQLGNALVRTTAEPTLDELREMHRVVRGAARIVRRTYGTLYDARPFRALVIAAAQAADDIR